MIDNANLIALFASGAPFVMADICTVTLLNGQVMRFCSADTPITIGANIWATTPLYIRDSIKIVAGLAVDDLNMTFFPSPNDLVGGLPLATVAYRGMLDGATFLMERAFFSPTWSTYVDKIIRYQGTIQQVHEGGRTQIPITVSSDLILLNTLLPVNVYQPGCRRLLYDGGCTVSKSAYGVNSSVSAGSSTTTMINCGLSNPGPFFGTLPAYAMGTGDGTTNQFTQTIAYIPVAVTAVYIDGGAVPSGWGYSLNGDQVTVNFVIAPGAAAYAGGPATPTGTITADITYSQSGWFDLGTVTFTSGVNNGLIRTVKSYTRIVPLSGPMTGVLNFTLPLPNVPGIGDTFTAYAGCDKQQATCAGKFHNISHFSGEPYVPVAETAY